jgi:hypothetical protein
MNAKDIITQVQKDAHEWLEMSENPASMVAGILANKIIKLNDRIRHLEKRLENAYKEKTHS